MMRRHFTGAMLLAALLARGAPADASNPPVGPLFDTPDRFVARATIIFQGRLESREARPPASPDSCRWEEWCNRSVLGSFRVEQVYKGKVGDIVRVRFSEIGTLDCNPPLPDGNSVFIAAFGDADKELFTGSCWYTPPAVEAALRYRQLLDQLEQKITASPGDPQPLLEKARFLMARNGVAEALSSIDRAFAYAPRNMTAALLKADIYIQEKRHDQALVALDSALAIAPDHADALRRRAVTLVRLGRAKELPESWRDFRRTEFVGVSFASQRLDGASFRGARLSKTDFRAADLRGADLSSATLWGSDFSGADLARANLRRSIVDAGVSLRDVNLAGADLQWVVGSPDLTRANLARARLVAVDMSRAQFVGANLQGAVLAGSRLIEANFDGADLSGADLSGANLPQASFHNARLHGARLTNARISAARFGGARYDARTIWPESFDPVFAGAILE